MNISLTTELEQFIQSQVASGKYTSSEEVILAGIRLSEDILAVLLFAARLSQVKSIHRIAS